MNKQDLEWYLERGDSFGFVKQSDDEKYFGWVMLKKLKAINKFFERFSREDNPNLYGEQEIVKSKPYLVRIAELRKEFHDSDKYPQNQDYKLNLTCNFSNLEEVEQFLKHYHLNLGEVKWFSEIPSD